MAKASRTPKLPIRKKKAPATGKKEKSNAKSSRKSLQLPAGAKKPGASSKLKPAAPPAKPKQAATKAKKVLSAKPAPMAAKPAAESKVVPRKPLPITNQKSTLIRQYETAVKLVYSQEFARAKEALEKIVQSALQDRDVAERARSLLSICEQKLSGSSGSPRSMEDLYNIGVALMNQGRLAEAREQFQKALKSNPRCEYVLYALAATHSRAGNLEDALETLKAAISLKQGKRFLARNDSDFEQLAQDSRFLALVRPDHPAAGNS